jgi:hypothetical protein
MANLNFQTISDPFATRRRASATEGSDTTHQTPKKRKPSHLRTRSGVRTNGLRSLSGSKLAKQHGGHEQLSDNIEQARQRFGRRIGTGISPKHAERALTRDALKEMFMMPLTPVPVEPVDIQE